MNDNFAAKLPNDTDRIIVVRTSNWPNHEWSVLANVGWDHFTKAMSALLDNEFVSYAEYENSGIAYRMIRRKDIGLYADAAAADRAVRLCLPAPE